MTQVSSRRLSKETQDKIFETFFTSISKLSSKEEVRDFLSKFLTPTEKIMLAKRLTIAVLLSKGYDYRSISNLLKVSTSTVRTINLLLTEPAGFQVVLESLEKDENWRKLLKDIDKFLYRVTSRSRFFVPEEQLQAWYKKSTAKK